MRKSYQELVADLKAKLAIATTPVKIASLEYEIIKLEYVIAGEKAMGLKEAMEWEKRIELAFEKVSRLGQ